VDRLPFSQACENNKAYILEILIEAFADRRCVLEIAAGTGQHACHFAGQMPWLRWQPTELRDNLPLLEPRCEHFAGGNLLAPLALDVRTAPWPVPLPDAVFGANFLHIMAFSAVQDFFEGLGQYGEADTLLAVYGPFNYRGRYTSPSNARFDQWLAQQHPESAIRHFEEIDRLARAAGFVLQADHDMPANNRLLLWHRP
jgi:hypothetical protein